MHSPAGSTGQGKARPNGVTEAAAEIAEIPIFALINVLGDAAGKHYRVDVTKIGDRVGQIKPGDVGRQGPHADGRDQRIGHCVGDFLQVRDLDTVAALPRETGARGVMFSGRIEPRDPALLDHLQPPADMDRGGGDDLAVFDEAELGGAAADIDVENAL
jgi:hypothetical protein